MKNKTFILATFRLLTLLALIGSAHAVPTISTLTLDESMALTGQFAQILVMGTHEKEKVGNTDDNNSINECRMALTAYPLGSSGKTVQLGVGNLTVPYKTVNGGYIQFTMPSTPGDYVFEVSGKKLKGDDYACLGGGYIDVKVKRAQINFGASPPKKGSDYVSTSPATCPAPYLSRTDPSVYGKLDPAKGELVCSKTIPQCPAGLQYMANDVYTGLLTCKTPTVPPAPLGWTARDSNGEVKFDSKPQPTLPCPASTPSWQWGTTYAKTSWDRMDCRLNSKPAF